MDAERDLVTMATEALQAHTRLTYKLPRTSKVREKACETLDNLRSIKAELDGSNVDFDPPQIKRDKLTEFRQLTLMHIPSSVTEEVQVKFNNFVTHAFKGACRKVLSVTLVTCPWYQVTQQERGERARHNVIFIVYLSHDLQYMAPTNYHDQEKAFVIDEGWLYAVELYHFLHFLSRGRTRCIEVLFAPKSAVLYEDEAWKDLRQQMDYKDLLSLQGSVCSCQGQCTGNIGKKTSKKGPFRLRETATFRDFCNSFRLIHHLFNLVSGLPPLTDVFAVEDLPALAKEGAEMLQRLYKDQDTSKRDIFNIVMKWNEEVKGQLSKLKYTNVNKIEAIIQKWQFAVRLEGRTLVQQALPDDHSGLLSIMERIGGPVGKLEPSQILLVARAGSHMYGLATPESDIDYVVIYAEKTEAVLGTCKALKDSFENRGPTKDFEYGAYEAKVFSEMVLKGSVVILELVFAEGHEYTSPLWKTLIEKKKAFLTEIGIQQFLGLIKNNFHLLDQEKHRGTPRDRKLFYQIFHKMDSIRYMMQGDIPPIRCSGEVKDYIMRIRTQPLNGDLDRDVLNQTAHQKFHELQLELGARVERLKENMDYALVSDWLLSVRGFEDRR
ncbi:uncharacterized protein LOC110462037 [Mizuhopecten yessoensis]|uniref:Uncharacterized protein n=1 Tax=Mizuhopecten yessoensis TaxID=6573 RepID=A0A210PZ06_MIZYE|nr:uncharacterized protein LOC110462037 [Mizuhopecten yessoensis]OWF41713.1 hypothetical protein KP79_PYT22858 [Mizuhopecten yessoensis]